MQIHVGIHPSSVKSLLELKHDPGARLTWGQSKCLLLQIIEFHCYLNVWILFDGFRIESRIYHASAQFTLSSTSSVKSVTFSDIGSFSDLIFKQFQWIVLIGALSILVGLNRKPVHVIVFTIFIIFIVMYVYACMSKCSPHACRCLWS